MIGWEIRSHHRGGNVSALHCCEQFFYRGLPDEFRQLSQAKLRSQKMRSPRHQISQGQQRPSFGFREILCSVQVPKGTNEKLNLLWIAFGKDDFLLEENKKLITSLKKSGIEHEWHLTESGHSWPVWRDYLAKLAPVLFR